MKDKSVSAALRASSCVGELGDDPTALVVTGVVVRPIKLLLLLLWRSWGEVTAWSRLKCAPVCSLTGDSRADEGAVEETWYFGVSGSLGCDWFMYSMSRVGNVWLLGRWKLLAGPPGSICLLWSDVRNPPTFGSGEKLKEAVGLRALPENEDAAVSVNVLDRDVVL